jgi:hypothetical protein
MKKILLLSVLALSVAAFSSQKASAWSDWKFGVGLNFDYKGGGNTLLWGLKKSEQFPAQGFAGYPGGGYPGAYGVPGGMPAAAEPGYGNYGAMGYNQNFSAPASAPAAQQPNSMKPVGYSYDPTGYLPAGYYPYYDYGSYQAPSYGNGR